MGILIFPHIKAVLTQFGIGAEGTWGIPALKYTMAFAVSHVLLLKTCQRPASPVKIKKAVVPDIADIDDFLQFI